MKKELEKYIDKIINGKELARIKNKELFQKSLDLSLKIGRPPCVIIISVGKNKASEIYIRNKIRACSLARITVRHHDLAANTSEGELLNLIENLNADHNVDGIICQLPLPKHIDSNKVIEAISPSKDVDGFHPYNRGLLAQGLDPILKPCTALAVMDLLAMREVEIKSKLVCIVGRSNIVGRPLVHLFEQANATVILCHSKTSNLKEITSQADILIVAIGQANFIKKDFVKQGAVVIDVGINSFPDKKGLTGDVDFADVIDKVLAISPVPGGVGPLTVFNLIHNTYLACQARPENYFDFDTENFNDEDLENEDEASEQEDE